MLQDILNWSLSTVNKSTAVNMPNVIKLQYTTSKLINPNNQSFHTFSKLYSQRKPTQNFINSIN